MLKRNYLSRKGSQVQATGEDGHGNLARQQEKGKKGAKLELWEEKTKKRQKKRIPNKRIGPTRRVGGAGKCKNFRQGINCCLVVLFRCLVEDTQQQ